MTTQDDHGPEQTYFSDPAVDRLLAMVMTLASELWVQKDRVLALENLLAEKGVLEPGSLDRYQPDEAEAARLAEARQAYVKTLLDNVLGREQSKSGPRGE
ncbi:hypothetical protein ACFOGJ_11840 [Marinibaculum pumilum]|uniref:Uncharacterized protein n=1 Tax=Marinibaculum pumilum TaxID=1766165 RepID=A0ABV7L047_9PROT